jgi:hypothetical protein
MRAVAVVVATLVGAVLVFLSVPSAGLRWQVGPAVDAIRWMNRCVTRLFGVGQFLHLAKS